MDPGAPGSLLTLFLAPVTPWVDPSCELQLLPRILTYTGFASYTLNISI